MSRERTPVLIEQEAGKAPRLVWTFWRKEKSLAPADIRTTDRPAPSIVPISTTTQATAYGILTVYGIKVLW